MAGNSSSQEIQDLNGIGEMGLAESWNVGKCL